MGGGESADPVVFSQLLREGRSRVFGYLLALVQNLADAEDLYQQAALVLWEKFDEYEPGTDFGAWASTVAHYTAINFLRRQSRRRVLFSEAALERLSAAQAELKTADCSARTDALALCLDVLPAAERRLIQLRYQSDLSVEAIARQEQRTVGAVYTALSRIRKALLTCVERRVSREGA